MTAHSITTQDGVTHTVEPGRTVVMYENGKPTEVMFHADCATAAAQVGRANAHLRYLGIRSARQTYRVL